MSVEISDEAIARVYEGLEDERIQDWILVVGSVEEAKLEERPIDGAFEEELAEERWQEAIGSYSWPVKDSGPTRSSSLRIVHDILTIRGLEATRADRQADIDGSGADAMLLNAEGQERSHRLWEKGVLRIFNPATSRSMWSVEFDDSLVATKEPSDKVQALTDLLVRHNMERR
jgi:hypothetical protein